MWLQYSHDACLCIDEPGRNGRLVSLDRLFLSIFLAWLLAVVIYPLPKARGVLIVLLAVVICMTIRPSHPYSAGAEHTGLGKGSRMATFKG